MEAEASNQVTSSVQTFDEKCEEHTDADSEMSSTAVPSAAHLASMPRAISALTTSQRTRDSMGDDVEEGDDVHFEV